MMPDTACMNVLFPALLEPNIPTILPSPHVTLTLLRAIIFSKNTIISKASNIGSHSFSPEIGLAYPFVLDNVERLAFFNLFAEIKGHDPRRNLEELPQAVFHHDERYPFGFHFFDERKHPGDLTHA
eukprot:TRINITY_DN28032_c0_g1_i1.p1 TRINITY_DN28032_c0_g1~~TRINITY_DN28032_c0_g1_i1.p1  ORF type:complete len:126 (-),score=2.19 TRINITY_DN28032_c0_g1_i1:113-490(-)